MIPGRIWFAGDLGGGNWTFSEWDDVPESFWDLAYRRGDHRRHWESSDPGGEIAAALGSGIPESAGRALDIGCGGGLEALWLAARGLEVVGVDSSACALEVAGRRARRAGLAVDWRHGSALALPVADRSIDLAIDRGCLHTIERERRKLYAKEVARVVRPAASFVIWAASEDDDELGLVGLGSYEARRLFEPRGFDRVEACPVVLDAAAGGLAAHRFILSFQSAGRPLDGSVPR